MTAALGLLHVIPVWCWVLCLLLGWGGWQKHRATAAGLQLAAQQQARAAAELAAERQARAEETRRAAAVQQVVIHARIKALADAAAADALRVERDRLLQRAQALANIGGDACRPGAANGSHAAASPATVYAHVLEGLADAAVQLAAEADRRGAAGAACQQAYRAVNGAE